MRKSLHLYTVLVLTVPMLASAAVYPKADNTNTLNLGTSWVGGVAPGSGDVANWSGTYSASAKTNSLNAALFAGTFSWQGITVGMLSGTALTTNTFFAGVTNLAAASETGNLVTVTTKATH